MRDLSRRSRNRADEGQLAGRAGGFQVHGEPEGRVLPGAVVRQVPGAPTKRAATEARTDQRLHHTAGLHSARAVTQGHQAAADERSAGVSARHTEEPSVRARDHAAEERGGRRRGQLIAIDPRSAVNSSSDPWIHRDFAISLKVEDSPRLPIERFCRRRRVAVGLGQRCFREGKRLPVYWLSRGTSFGFSGLPLRCHFGKLVFESGIFHPREGIFPGAVAAGSRRFPRDFCTRDCKFVTSLPVRFVVYAPRYLCAMVFVRLS